MSKSSRSARAAGLLAVPALAILAADRRRRHRDRLHRSSAGGPGRDAPVPPPARTVDRRDQGDLPDLPETWIAAVMAQESGFRPDAHADDSNGGTWGLFADRTPRSGARLRPPVGQPTSTTTAPRTSRTPTSTPPSAARTCAAGSPACDASAPTHPDWASHEPPDPRRPGHRPQRRRIRPAHLPGHPDRHRRSTSADVAPTHGRLVCRRPSRSRPAHRSTTPVHRAASTAPSTVDASCVASLRVGGQRRRPARHPGRRRHSGPHRARLRRGHLRVAPAVRPARLPRLRVRRRPATPPPPPTGPAWSPPGTPTPATPAHPSARSCSGTPDGPVGHVSLVVAGRPGLRPDQGSCSPPTTSSTPPPATDGGVYLITLAQIVSGFVPARQRLPRLVRPRSARVPRCPPDHRTRRPPGRRSHDARRTAPTSDERLAALHDQLTTAVERPRAQSDALASRCSPLAARFPTYSPSNVLLIAAQRPDATRVAGIRTWNEPGPAACARASTASRSSPPALYRRPHDRHLRRQAATPSRSAASAARRSGLQRVLRGFRVVHVFDVTQTDGRPAPRRRARTCSPATPRTGLWEHLAALVADDGFTVERGPLPAGANGYTAFDDRTVRIRDDVDPAQAVKTLAHELGHIRADHEHRFPDYAGQCALPRPRRGRSRIHRLPRHHHRRPRRRRLLRPLRRRLVRRRPRAAALDRHVRPGHSHRDRRRAHQTPHRDDADNRLEHTTVAACASGARTADGRRLAALREFPPLLGATVATRAATTTSTSTSSTATVTATSTAARGGTRRSRRSTRRRTQAGGSR